MKQRERCKKREVMFVLPTFAMTGALTWQVKSSMKYLFFWFRGEMVRGLLPGSLLACGLVFFLLLYYLVVLHGPIAANILFLLGPWKVCCLVSFIKPFQGPSRNIFSQLKSPWANKHQDGSSQASTIPEVRSKKSIYSYLIG